MKKTLLILSLLVNSLIGKSQPPKYIDTIGLKGWWSFTGNSLDSSINNNHGVVNGCSLSTDRFGNLNSCYSFDGVDDYISIMNSPSLSGYSNLTISGWFYLYPTVKTSSDKYYSMVSKWWGKLNCGGNTDDYGCWVVNNLSGSRFVGGTNSYNKQPSMLNSNYVFTENTWTHFVFTNDKINGGKFYLDGVLVDSFKTVGVLCNSSNNLFFGCDSGLIGYSRFFRGKLDDIGIWDRVLSGCEISRVNKQITSFILEHPQNDTVLSGSFSSFSITDTLTTSTYQWEVNTGSGFISLVDVLPYSGVKTKTLMINPVLGSMNGYKYRCVRNDNSCFDTSNSGILTIRTTSIKDIVRGDFKVYPNPVTDVVFINSPTMIDKVEVFNVVGQSILIKQCNSNRIEVNVNNLNNGIYFLKINDQYLYKISKN